MLRQISTVRCSSSASFIARGLLEIERAVMSLHVGEKLREAPSRSLSEFLAEDPVFVGAGFIPSHACLLFQPRMRRQHVAVSVSSWSIGRRNDLSREAAAANRDCCRPVRGSDKLKPDRIRRLTPAAHCWRPFGTHDRRMSDWPTIVIANSLTNYRPAFFPSPPVRGEQPSTGHPKWPERTAVENGQPVLARVRGQSASQHKPHRSFLAPEATRC